MATLKRKDRSPYWHGIYKLANGKLRSRSTKTTKKREARRIVNEWELEEQKIEKTSFKMNLISQEKSLYINGNQRLWEIQRFR